MKVLSQLQHYMTEQHWIEKALDERQNNAKHAYPYYEMNELPELYDTHNPEDGAPLAMLIVEDDLEALFAAKVAIVEEAFGAPNSSFSLYTCGLCPMTMYREVSRYSFPKGWLLTI